MKNGVVKIEQVIRDQVKMLVNQDPSPEDATDVRKMDESERMSERMSVCVQSKMIAARKDGGKAFSTWPNWKKCWKIVEEDEG